MPKFDVAKHDLERLVGKEFTVEEWEDLFLYAKCELDDIWEHEGKIYFKADAKDTNRPDLWSAEGIARQVRWALGMVRGLPRYDIEESDVIVYVDEKLKDIRPFGVYAVVEDLELDEEALKQIIQLQEKVALTLGRKRKEVAIGTFDFDKLRPPFYYKAVEPKKIEFVPLNCEREMSAEEILEEHEKGKEYGHLIKGRPYYPLLVDSEGNVLSMPPIINSETHGKVTEETKSIFIDITGWHLETIMLALNVIVTALVERGGKIRSVRVIYKDFELKTPDLTPKEFEVDLNYIKRLAGVELTDKDIKDLLERMMYEVDFVDRRAKLRYPAFRNDIMHSRDVLEDVLIAYGYNNIEPEEPELAVQGGGDDFVDFENAIRDLMVGFGLQEVMTFNLTNKEAQFDKMNIPEEDIVEIENPISQKWSALRRWLLPSLMEFLGQNTHEEYPQRIFEVGKVTLIDESRETKTISESKLGVAIAHPKVTFTEAKEILDSVLRHLGAEYAIREIEHGSFISGRAGEIIVGGRKVGIIGEIHPQVLENWGVEMPVAAFEIFLRPFYKKGVF
ncbi:MAG: phenylalanine--tRNA ligase subunit beta [Thermococcus sp.]|uniref:phenylalanine--tRNA ligase subunit beta n=1 Tax=Thermococcus sp. TaxID=35749 RepID=UPI00262B0DDF|nr:phenylalanine--tRNA ligase subunit beta [Thermococcus sp.]MCD6140258.1 phenylalanine--tRNA ligase subunit beta [Thermococcus sp.]